MARLKGTSKTGGRQSGTPNKITTDLRTWINELLDGNRQQIIKDIKRLEPQQRVGIFEKLLSYAVPKLQSVVIHDSPKEEEKDVSKDWDEVFKDSPKGLELLDKFNTILCEMVEEMYRIEQRQRETDNKNCF